MEIIWHHDTCVEIRGEKTRVIIDPTSQNEGLEGEIVLLSGPSKSSEKVKNIKKTFDWPGEYEINDVPITGFQTENENVIFTFRVDGIDVCHLGDLDSKLKNDLVNQIGDVDVLLIKFGPNANLKAKDAMEVIEAIEPRIVIPLGDDDLLPAMKELGIENVEKMGSFSMKSASGLPNDQMKYVVLNAK